VNGGPGVASSVRWGSSPNRQVSFVAKRLCQEVAPLMFEFLPLGSRGDASLLTNGPTEKAKIVDTPPMLSSNGP